ncbi:hypothetical protein Pelo_1261 [Pelomyxa schiedti]|nr:hypothetical protein Pelo_1261 [Pelomyxa schiedti]
MGGNTSSVAVLPPQVMPLCVTIPTATQTQKRQCSIIAEATPTSGCIDRALPTLRVSRVVWDIVVQPGWLDWCTYALLRLAEALFPLVGLVCRRLLLLLGASSYSLISDAARLLCPSCVAWIVKHRRINTGPQWCPPRSAISSSSTMLITVSGDDGDDAKHREQVAIKEVSAAVTGLVKGRHLEEARMFLGDGGTTNVGTLPALTTLRDKVREYVKASCGSYRISRGALESGCESGNLELVKWLVSFLRIGKDEAPWILYPNPLQSAMGSGDMGVISWLFDKFDLVKLHPSVLTKLVEDCASGQCPSNIKWCFEKFPVVKSCAHTPKFQRALLGNTHSSVEDFQGLESNTEGGGIVNESTFKHIEKIEVAKSVIMASPITPSNEILNCLCQKFGEVEFTEWLCAEKHFILTPATFVASCSTQRCGATLAKWLSTKVSLTQPDVVKSLQCALRCGNLEVAEWLDERFFIMDAANSDPVIAGTTLVEICDDPESRSNELQWFIQHLKCPLVSATYVQDAISAALSHHHRYHVDILLGSFTEFEPHRHPQLFAKLVTAYMNSGDINPLQRLLFSASSSVVSKEFLAERLTSRKFYVYSSKMVKWIIRQFDLQYSHINLKKNCLLFHLLEHRKNMCAQWLIESFQIPLSDIIYMKCSPISGLDVSGWQMLVNHYPAIDTSVIRQHLIPIVTLSPHIALFTIHHFNGITLEELREYCAQKESCIPLLADAMVFFGVYNRQCLVRF